MKLGSLLGVFAIAFILPVAAGASVKKTGTWPAREPKVDLKFDGKPSEGLKQLADEAEWSLVVSDAVKIDTGDVHVSVDSQPADAVLEALFVGHDVVAMRRGKLITVLPASAALPGDEPAPPPAPPPPPAVDAPPAPPPLPPLPPMPTARGKDRTTYGGSIVVQKDEIVHDLTVTGGSVEIDGTVTGDIAILGGSATIRDGGRVLGDAAIMGGEIHIEKGGRIEGDVGIAGGHIERDEGSFVGGDVSDGAGGSGSKKGKHVKKHHGDDDDDDADEADEAPAPEQSRAARAVSAVGKAITKSALLFVLGCVLLALLAAPMERLRVEVASRPMRSFALGIVGTLGGAIAVCIVVTLLCITVVGIPVAVLGLLLAIVALYGAIASVLTTLGAALIGGRTQNPYVHLLLGCGIFLVLGTIPVVGVLVTIALVAVAVGAMVATRAGGLFEHRNRKLPGGLV